MKRKIAHKEVVHSGPDSVVPFAVAGGLLGAAVGKVVGRTNGSAMTGAALGAIAAGALARSGSSLNLPHAVDYLQTHLGPQATAYLSGVDDEVVVGSWARGTAEPEEITGRRLWSAYEATRSLVEAYDASTARSWFLGMNPTFEDASPARVLRSSHTPEIWQEVVLAAREFAET